MWFATHASRLVIAELRGYKEVLSRRLVCHFHRRTNWTVRGKASRFGDRKQSCMDFRNISANLVIVWVALILGLLSAVAIGSAVGGSDMRMVAAVFGISTLLIAFVKLKTTIWVLLPISWFLTGRLSFLPLPLTVRDMCFLVVIGFFTLFFAIRALPWKRKLNPLEYLIYINIFYLISAYVRNPVGLFAFQSELVGGRPYFEIALAFAAFAILSRINPTSFIAKIFPLFFLIPAAVVSALDITARLIPQLAYPISLAYGGVSDASVSGSVQVETTVGETRITSLKDVGQVGVLALVSKYRPLTLVSPLLPLRALMLVMCLTAIFAAGYRSVVLIASVYLVLSTILRRSAQDVWTGVSLLFLGIVLLISLQGSTLQLPLAMQRALSWLPGDWDHEAVADAEGSSQWRFEMWEWAWNDERIMRDKVWGQGFGFTLDEMNIIAASMMSGQQGNMFLGQSDRENFMITGTLHSGPLSTIKFIGVVGFILYFSLLVYMAVLGWRLCHRAHGTKAFSLALFVGIPIIYEPIHFVAIFGALELSYVKTLFYAGLMNMADNYLKTSTRDNPFASQTNPRLRTTIGPSRQPGPAFIAQRI